jgi:hypothetical protein
MMITWKHIAMHNSTCPIWQEAVWNILLKHFDGDEEEVVVKLGIEMAGIGMEAFNKQQER